jgi:predicted DNA-binding protein with PD1-like motif
MKFRNLGKKYLVKLEKGEDIINALTKFCQEQGIKSGIVVNGIGGVSEVVLKYFNLEKKEYIAKKFSGKNFELLSLSGNISLLENKPFLHLHAVLGDEKYQVFGGHLDSAIVAVTAEIIIDPSTEFVSRKMDNKFDLNLLDF